MNVPFIRNHQYNFIRNQANAVLHARRTVSDPKVVESVRLGALGKVAELYPDVEDQRKRLLESIADLKTPEDVQQFFAALEPYLVAFPMVNEAQLRKLFPKSKKLKLPDLSLLDFRYISYLSWDDLATNKKYIVYPRHGQLVGIEGRYTATNKKSFCFVCNRFEELTLFTAITKKRPANSSPDYYNSVGNYLCMNGQDCNGNLTDVAPLERFLDSVTG
ncbi:MAG TPA: FusB/FusC family EF-G-binding protein [Paenibacillus sp.]|nr:FusB/FusC family EF-G-binding protein [Paenibacillus sp.]